MIRWGEAGTERSDREMKGLHGLVPPQGTCAKWLNYELAQDSATYICTGINGHTKCEAVQDAVERVVKSLSNKRQLEEYKARRVCRTFLCRVQAWLLANTWWLLLGNPPTSLDSQPSH